MPNFSPDRRHERGAVFVEKLIVYLPLLLTFFGAWELAELGAANLVVQRASAAAGRAAVVVLADDPAFSDSEPVGSFGGQRRADIELAAGMVLSAVPRLSENFVVELSEPSDPQGPIDVSLTAEYSCGLVSLICGDDESVELASTTTHTYQGARYAYSTPDIGSTAPALSDGGFPGGFRAATFDNNDARAQRENRACSTSCPTRQEVERLKRELRERGKRGEFCAKGATIAWSGGPDVMKAAQAWGKKGKGQTLEQTPGGQWLDSQQLFSKKCSGGGLNKWDPAIVWDKASRYFMNCAKGLVYKFQACDRVKAGGALGLNTWEQVEKPILDKKGKKVQGVNWSTLQTEALCNQT